MTIYENERVIVTENPTNRTKVTITDKFAAGGMSMNRAAFEEMCKAVAQQLEEQKCQTDS